MTTELSGRKSSNTKAFMCFTSKGRTDGPGRMGWKHLKLSLISLAFVLAGAGHLEAQQGPVRVNVGGPAYTDSKGQVWSADFGFNAGKLSGCAPTATVTGTTDPTLFKSARYGSPPPEMQYTFAVANGSYQANLYFAETCANLQFAGARVFDVQMQSAVVFSALDIFAAAGGNTALVKSANVTVTNGTLTIQFLHRVNGAIVNAIEIIPLGSTAAGPSISLQPANQTMTAGQTATFSVVASGTAPLTYQWQKNGSAVTAATAASYTTPVTTTADSGELFRVVVSNSAGNVTSNSATLTVNPGTSNSSVDVITYHYDNGRDGQNLNETALTPANVNSTQFGKKGEFTVDGKVDAQPLYLSQATIGGQKKNVLYVATEHGSVYAFDADSINGTTSAFLWKTSTLGSGETTSDNRGCGQVSPEIGITATPVIDRSRNALYVVAMSKNAGGTYFQRLHALDLTTGQELFGGPMNITATYPGTGDNSSGGNVVFDPKQYKERPGLLQINGTIYTTWSSHCDIRPYTSWVMAFSADTLAQTSVLNLVPNGNEGGIWMAGTAPAADSAGNLFFIIGNGTFDTTLNASGFPVNGNCGNCFVKLSTSTGLKLADYFTPHNTVAESNADTDFGSGGGILMLDVTDSGGNTRHLAVGAGKDSLIYVVDRDAMGKFNASTDQIYQEISGQLGGGVYSMPAFFNNTVYYGAVGDALKAFPVTVARLAAAPSSQSTHHFGYPGTTPSVSANGTTNGIVWAIENSGAVLYAYDATDLTRELYNSNQAANNRDHFSANKFITPMVVNGKVYVGTATSVAVFGLLP
jgi:hypothetical protein